MKKFTQRIKSLPEPLQRQVWLRFGLAAALLVFGLASAIIWRDKTMLVIIAVAAFSGALGVRLCCRDYIVITGICSDVDTTVIRKRSKAVVIIAAVEGQEKAIRIPLRQQFRKLAVGDVLDVYVDAAAMIYERDGIFHLQSYIAIDKRAST